MGAGVWSNGGIQTSTSRLAEKYFGSWAEYELISNQTINSMASPGFLDIIKAVVQILMIKIAILAPLTLT